MVCGVLGAAAGLLGGRGAAASAAVSPKGVRTNEDRIAYLESYGWSVSSDPIAVEELIIPSSSTRPTASTWNSRPARASI